MTAYAWIVFCGVLLAPYIAPLVWAVAVDAYAGLMAKWTQRRQAQPDLTNMLDFYVRQRARKNEAMRQMRAVVREHRDHDGDEPLSS